MQNFLKNFFSIGYGWNEWYRDRHTFFSILFGWLSVSLIALTAGKLDLHTFELQGYAVLGVAGASVIKNWLGNNTPPSPPGGTQ